MAHPSRGSLFTVDGAWHGGFYELGFFYPPGADLDAALRALWSFPQLTGPVAYRNQEPWNQTLVEPNALQGELDGVLSLPGGKQTACATWAYEWESRYEVEFGIPLGSLGHAWPDVDSFPIGTNAVDAEAWEPRLERLLLRMAGHLHARVPFSRALTGMEGIDWALDDQLTRPGPVPASHGAGIIDVEGSELIWHPPTIGGGFLFNS
jgi:hypothetical protein